MAPPWARDTHRLALTRIFCEVKVADIMLLCSGNRKNVTSSCDADIEVEYGNCASELMMTSLAFLGKMLPPSSAACDPRPGQTHNWVKSPIGSFLPHLHEI